MASTLPAHRTLNGVLISESLRVGGELSGVPLQVTKLERIAVGDTTRDQPHQWTLLHFRAPEDTAGQLAEALANCLAPTGGWYVDFSTTTEVYVVFAGRVFRYALGDATARAEVQAYARSVGVPETQLDWKG
ncbi:hypothetical protein [Streptomyces sp. NBC_00286]|uniref:hypothetical protein n=1 Tax=Streptomyces sp. NBC_00286 TaxID=2975701 RepID=UPI002E2E2F64|nr:hypothetical protein [Streptomyces sp. NBC_00286]